MYKFTLAVLFLIACGGSYAAIPEISDPPPSDSGVWVDVGVSDPPNDATSDASYVSDGGAVHVDAARPSPGDSGAETGEPSGDGSSLGKDAGVDGGAVHVDAAGFVDSGIFDAFSFDSSQNLIDASVPDSSAHDTGSSVDSSIDTNPWVEDASGYPVMVEPSQDGAVNYCAYYQSGGACIDGISQDCCGGNEAIVNGVDYWWVCCWRPVPGGML